MALKLKEQVPQPSYNTNNLVFEYRPTKTGIPHPPKGMPMGTPEYSYVAFNAVHVPAPPPVEMPETKLPRALNYYADYGGCGFWRMIWPEFVLNGYQKMCISGLTSMVLDLRFYQGLKAIRMQRQATPVQKQFISELKKASGSGPHMQFKLLYEVDDIVFKDDIPDYNRCKEAFVQQEIIDSILEIIGMCDEMTVTCPFMKQYYQEKTGNKKITVIPNYPPKFWLDRFYNRERIIELFEKNKKRPRILYSGSGTHIDVLNKTGMNDDFKHVTDAIIKARKKFKFVWKSNISFLYFSNSLYFSCKSLIICIDNLVSKISLISFIFLSISLIFSSFIFHLSRIFLSIFNISISINLLLFIFLNS